MDETLDPRDARAVLRNVGAYRQLRRHVRSKANWGLVFGAFMLAVWYFFLPAREQFGPFGLIYLGLAAVECRTPHKHGVEPSLPADQRKDAKKRFADSGVTSGWAALPAIRRLRSSAAPWSADSSGAHCRRTRMSRTVKTSAAAVP